MVSCHIYFLSLPQFNKFCVLLQKGLACSEMMFIKLIVLFVDMGEQSNNLVDCLPIDTM